MAEQPPGEVWAELRSANQRVQERLERRAEKCKGNRFLKVRHGRCQAGGIHWGINVEELDAAILEHYKLLSPAEFLSFVF